MTALAAIAVFWGAALLFLVQPMAARWLLPTLGGSPAVWIASMVFFQSALLAGYAIAHAMRRVRIGVQVGIYAALLALGAVCVPIDGVAWASPAFGFEAWWVAGALGWMVGPAFIALAAAGPTLQRWYADKRGREPYALFAASNAGSLLGLVAYPVLMEPSLGLAQQGVWWSAGFGTFALLAIGFGVWCVRARSEAASDAIEEAPRKGGRAASWLVWSFAGSSLLLGTTLKMTTDVASVPLLWVIPLGVYLLTFVVAFRPGRRKRESAPIAGRVFAVAVVALAVATLKDAKDPPALVYAMYLVALALGAYVCHARLYAARPDAERLTGYYLCIATGGALGGVFNAIVAPMAFDWIAEYPIAIAIACAALGYTGKAEPAPAAPRLTMALLIMIAFAGWIVFSHTTVVHVAGRLALPVYTADVLGVFVPALAMYGLQRDGWRLGGAFMGLAGAMALGGPFPGAPGRPTADVVLRERTFFGVTTVLRSPDGYSTGLVHGATEHGAEITRMDLKGVPTSYYHRVGPAGDVLGELRRWRDELGGRGARVALIGLGAGSLAAYADAGDRVDIYELDPLVVEIASDPQWFSFVPSAKERGVDMRATIGDGRQRLAAATAAGEIPVGGYDVIVLDAFTSDAIPPHLLTREAFEVYREALAPGGVVLAHISNRYLDLQPVVLGGASAAGLAAAERWHTFLPGYLAGDGVRTSRWIAMSRDPSELDFLPASTWIRLDPERDPSRLWTDDFHDIATTIDWTR